MAYKTKNFYISKSIEENLEYIYSLELDENISNKERIINISTYIFYAQEEYKNDYFNKMYDMLNISRLTNDTIVTILRIANITRLGPIDRYKEIYLYIKNDNYEKTKRGNNNRRK